MPVLSVLEISISKGLVIFYPSLFDQIIAFVVLLTRTYEMGKVYLQNDGGQIRLYIACHKCVNLVKANFGTVVKFLLSHNLVQ